MPPFTPHAPSGVITKDTGNVILPGSCAADFGTGGFVVAVGRNTVRIDLDNRDKTIFYHRCPTAIKKYPSVVSYYIAGIAVVISRIDSFAN